MVNPPRSACLCPVFPLFVLACSPAVHDRVDSLFAWIYLCVFSPLCIICMLSPYSACSCPIYTRCSCAHARPRLINACLPVARCGFHPYLFGCQMLASTTTKCTLLVSACTCACMLGAGMYHTVPLLYHNKYNPHYEVLL